MKENPEFEIDDPNYRPVSALAIASVFFALGSAATLFHVAFLPICFVAILMAVIALIKMGKSDKNFIGENMAWTSIFLSCMFGCAGVSFFAWKNERGWGAARNHADDWLQLIQEGDMAQAHQLTLPNSDRRDPDISLAEYYSEENQQPDPTLVGVRQPATGFKSYWDELEPQRTILKDGKKGEIVFVRRDKHEIKRDGEYYHLVYRYVPADPKLRKKTNVGKNKATIRFPLEFEIRMHRPLPDATTGVHWQIHEVSIVGVQQSNSEFIVE